MRLDRQRRHADTETVDAVVIGTGAGGAPILAELARAGCRVVALEAGPNLDPDTHVPDATVAAGRINWLEERIVGGDTPEAFGANNSGTGVGGSTLHWGAFTPRPDQGQLRIRERFGVGVDWPIDLDTLRPFLVAAEQAIGVSGPDPYPWDPGRRYAMPPAAPNAPADAMRRACDAHGIRAAGAPAAVLTETRIEPAHGARPACIGCGWCHQGCRIGAKASMDVTFLPQAVADGAEIRPDCRAVDIERDGSGRVTGVVYIDADGRRRRQLTRALVLAAGAVETPRLLLHTGLANASGQVGRNYMAHVATQVWGTFEREMRCYRGYPSSLITEDMLAPDGADFASGYLVQSLGVVPTTWATQVARARGLWGRPLAAYIDRYSHVAGIGINGDCLPSDRNRLTLADETDAFGVPRALVRFSYGDNERALHAHASALMTRLWETAGATDIWTCERVAHTIGTCRMGTDPDASVVDDTGRSWEIPNLWISDNSTFPSALAANPALTIIALALRTAGAIRAA